MEVSTNSASDFFSKINIGKSFQEIVPYSVKTPSDSTRVSLLKRRKPLDKDALLAVKVDPAVLEAQVTVDTRAKAPDAPPQPVGLALFAKSKRGEPSYPSFEEALSMQQAALLKLSPLQLELLMAFADTLRQQRLYTQRHLECAFCKNNGSPVSWYASHALRDRRRVRCPVLRALRCPRCGATGDRAHTIKYCPLNFFSGGGSALASARRPRSPATRQTSVRCKPERSCYYWAHCSSHESPIQCLFKCSRLGFIHVKNVQKFERKTDENISCGLDQKSTVSARHTTGLSRWVESADILCCGHATDAGKKSNTIKNLVHSITIKIKRKSNVFEQRSWNIARRTVNTRTRRRISDGLSPIGANQIRALSLHCY